MLLNQSKYHTLFSKTKEEKITEFAVLFVFVALHPKSIAMVMEGQSVHLTTLFPGLA